MSLNLASAPDIVELDRIYREGDCDKWLRLTSITIVPFAPIPDAGIRWNGLTFSWNSMAIGMASMNLSEPRP